MQPQALVKYIRPTENFVSVGKPNLSTITLSLPKTGIKSSLEVTVPSETFKRQFHFLFHQEEESFNSVHKLSQFSQRHAREHTPTKQKAAPANLQGAKTSIYLATPLPGPRHHY